MPYQATLLNRVGPVTVLAIVALLFAAPARAQNASIGGTVMMDPSEKPLVNAEIVITGRNRSTRSDSAGNFVLSGLSAGKHSVVVRLVGYESSNLEINLTASQKFEADFLLKAGTTTLEKVDVKAKAKVDNGEWTIKLAEFEERRAQGIGKFLTKEEFEKEDGRPVSSFLAKKISGIRVVPVNGQSFLASTRGGAPGSFAGGEMVARFGLQKLPSACYMQVVVNGVVRWNGSQDAFDLDVLNTKDIIGFEFYTTATTPLQYNATRSNGAGSCGTVVIWTKGGG